MEVRPVQPEKADPPMLVSPFCKVMEVRPVQPEKADPPMLVSPSGRVMEVRPVQPEKADSPMLVSPSGRVMEVRPVQTEKALSPIFVTLLGTVVVLHPDIKVLVDVSIIALQLSRESYTGLLLSTTNVLRFGQLENRFLSIFVKPAGRMMEVRLLQP